MDTYTGNPDRKIDAESEKFSEIAMKARKTNETEWQKKFDKYEMQGFSEDEATGRANRKMHEEDMNAFIANYYTLLSYIFKLNHGYIHSKVVSGVNKYLSQDIGKDRAIRL